MLFHAQKRGRVKAFGLRLSLLLCAAALLAGCGKRPSAVDLPPDVQPVSHIYPAPEPLPASLDPHQTENAP